MKYYRLENEEKIKYVALPSEFWLPVAEYVCFHPDYKHEDDLFDLIADREDGPEWFLEELSDNINRRIYIFERASQFDLLSMNPETFMWVSPAPETLLERYNLVQKKCADNKKVYKDVLIYKKGYKLTKLDRQFITELCESKRKHL